MISNSTITKVTHIFPFLIKWKKNLSTKLKINLCLSTNQNKNGN